MPKCVFYSLKVFLCQNMEEDVKINVKEMFNVTLWISFTLEIYMLHCVKKYMGPFRFFGTQKKLPVNMQIFENLRFLSAHFSKPPFSKKLFLTFTFTFFPYSGLKIFLDNKTHILAWKLTIKIHLKIAIFWERGFEAWLLPFWG